MAYKNIIIEKKNSYAIVKINRPKVLNALNKETMIEITNSICELGQDKKIKAVILTGEGDKAFIAGADISAMANLTPLEAKDFSEYAKNLANSFESLSRSFRIALILL